MLNSIKNLRNYLFEPCGYQIANYRDEEESKEYDASQFDLNDSKIIYRNAKQTPKKNGMFVTFWKRTESGPIAPFHVNDNFDFFIVNAETITGQGLFVLPKAILLQKGIISSVKKDGKRAFRVYPIWDQAKSTQAMKSQRWQLNYFYEIGEKPDIQKMQELFK